MNVKMIVSLGLFIMVCFVGNFNNGEPPFFATNIDSVISSPNRNKDSGHGSNVIGR